MVKHKACAAPPGPGMEKVSQSVLHPNVPATLSVPIVRQLNFSIANIGLLERIDPSVSIRGIFARCGTRLGSEPAFERSPPNHQLFINLADNLAPCRADTRIHSAGIDERLAVVASDVADGGEGRLFEERSK